MLNKTIIRKVVTSEVGEFLLPLNYKPLKTKGDLLASFTCSTENNNYRFMCYTNKYNDYQLVYFYDFGINDIVKILKEIDSYVPLERLKYEITGYLTGVCPGYLLDPLHIDRAYKFFSTEEELLLILQEVKSFYYTTFVPFCEKFSKIVNLDRLINSTEDFRTDDFRQTIPISFFYVTRLIIAKLANNKNFDYVVDRNFKALEELWEKEGALYNRFDKTKPEVFAVEYLKNNY